MMLQSLLHLGLIAYYNINQSEIENLYCVNKDKPEMCCKGKCYIGKRLDQSNRQLPAKDTQEERDIPLFLVSSTASLLTFPESKSMLPSGLNAELCEGHLGSIHHPPVYLA